MKSYDVYIWKKITKSTTVTVEAENEEDAKEVARDKVRYEPASIFWNEKISDSGSSTYENRCC